MTFDCPGFFSKLRKISALNFSKLRSLYWTETDITFAGRPESETSFPDCQAEAAAAADIDIAFTGLLANRSCGDGGGGGGGVQ